MATPPALDRELALTFARNRLGATYALPLLVAVVAAAAMIWIDARVVAIWAIAILAAHAIMIALCRRFAAAPASEAATKVWTGRFVVADLFGGLAWAAVLLLAPHTDQGLAGLDVLRFATMLIVVSVITSLASALPAAATAGTLPVTVTLVGVYLARDEFLYMILSLLALGVQIFFLVFASRLRSATLTMLEYRAEKDQLIAELGAAKSMSDESRRRAEEANLAKSRFLATMSHELRTPLNAILGFSEIMKREVLGPMGVPAYKDYVNDIHASGRHLLDLINEILDLSRIEAGRQELYEEQIDLVELTAECCHLMQLKAHAKNVVVREVFEHGLALLWADDRAVRQISLNLLSNAIKFTPAGGEISVAVGSTADGGQYLSVCDNGPGIPPEEIPIVLSSFGQGSIAIKSAEQGAGLGLPIVKALMQLHGGSFELRSKPNQGTEAIVTFPASRVLQGAPPTADENGEVRGLLRAG